MEMGKYTSENGVASAARLCKNLDVSERLEGCIPKGGWYAAKSG